MKKIISLFLFALLVMSSIAMAVDWIEPTTLLNGCYDGEYNFRIGDSVTACGKTITLTNVGTSSVIIDVDGTTRSIASGATSIVNGVEVNVVSIISRTLASDSSAVLKLKCFTPSITPGPADDYPLKVGDSVSVCGKTLTLTNVGTSSVIVNVDGTVRNIVSGATSIVNGIEVTVDSVISRTIASDSSAVLKLKCALPTISPKKSLWTRLTGRFFSLI